MAISHATTDTNIVPQEVLVSPDDITIPRRATLVGERSTNGIVTGLRVLFEDGVSSWVYPYAVMF